MAMNENIFYYAIHVPLRFEIGMFAQNLLLILPSKCTYLHRNEVNKSKGWKISNGYFIELLFSN